MDHNKWTALGESLSYTSATSWSNVGERPPTPLTRARLSSHPRHAHPCLPLPPYSLKTSLPTFCECALSALATKKLHNPLTWSQSLETCTSPAFWSNVGEGVSVRERERCPPPPAIPTLLALACAALAAFGGGACLAGSAALAAARCLGWAPLVQSFRTVHTNRPHSCTFRGRGWHSCGRVPRLATNQGLILFHGEVSNHLPWPGRRHMRPNALPDTPDVTCIGASLQSTSQHS